MTARAPISLRDHPRSAPLSETLEECSHSFETREITEYRLQLGSGEIIRGHLYAWFTPLRMDNPAGEISSRVVERAGSKSVGASDVCQRRTNSSECECSPDCVTHRTSPRHEHLLANSGQRVRRRRSRKLLRLIPRVELRPWLSHHQHRHLRVLMPAELGALAAVDPG